MPSTVQNKNTYTDTIKLCLDRLKKAVNTKRERKQQENNTSHSNTYKDGIKSELERLKIKCTN